MKGFIGILLLLVFLGAMSLGIYFLFIQYQRFSGADYAVSTLKGTESNYTGFESYQPTSPTVLKPLIRKADDGTVSYISSLSPCVTLIEDRTWNIFASKANVLPAYKTRMFYDRFWRVAWLGLLPKQSSIVQDYAFYGPFRYSDLPKRDFLEYLLIGRDVTQDRGKFKILTPDQECNHTISPQVVQNL